MERIDAARTGPRSQFVRDALVEKLEGMGLKVDDLKTVSPDRTGKGGPKSKYPEARRTAYIMNEKKKPVLNLMPDPNLPPKVKAAADALEKIALKKVQKASKRKPSAKGGRGEASH